MFPKVGDKNDINKFFAEKCEYFLKIYWRLILKYNV